MDESVGALGAPGFEHEVVSTQGNARLPQEQDRDTHRSGNAA
jgi:hypothetical protein